MSLSGMYNQKHLDVHYLNFRFCLFCGKAF